MADSLATGRSRKDPASGKVAEVLERRWSGPCWGGSSLRGFDSKSDLVGWMARSRHRGAKLWLSKSHMRRAIHDQNYHDLAGFSQARFPGSGVGETGEVVVQRKLRRSELLVFFERLAPRLVGIEACGTADHSARALMALGHELKLMPPIYVKRQKNHMTDAEPRRQYSPSCRKSTRTSPPHLEPS